MAEAAVIAIPDEKWSERPLACVAFKPGQSATPEAVAGLRHALEGAGQRSAQAPAASAMGMWQAEPIAREPDPAPALTSLFAREYSSAGVREASRAWRGYEDTVMAPPQGRAGSVFLGDWSPESAGDYASGTNHVLPTYGYTATYSSLGLADFQKRMTVQQLSPQGLLGLASTIEIMAQAEQLTAHKNAVTLRVNALKEQA